jgi:metal-responsive CopG/Arc/MetJ family transcriptional regulator
MPTAKVAITIEEELLGEVDQLVSRGTFANRSQAIADAVRKQIQRLQKRRLAEEAAKLDLREEQEMAEESFTGETTWPEY